MQIGIDAVALAVPEGYLELQDLAQARGVPPGKFVEGLGVRRMSVARAHEDRSRSPPMLRGGHRPAQHRALHRRHRDGGRSLEGHRPLEGHRRLGARVEKSEKWCSVHSAPRVITGWRLSRPGAACSRSCRAGTPSLAGERSARRSGLPSNAAECSPSAPCSCTRHLPPWCDPHRIRSGELTCAAPLEHTDLMRAKVVGAVL